MTNDMRTIGAGWRGGFSRLALIAALGATAGCQSTGSGPASTAASSGDPALAQAVDLLVVDCLLPARVKRLGSRLTYLEDRRAIKTSGVDCEIKGGEYVSYDRADTATALAVWLEPAKKGDPEAQNYVGEIFERGYGTQPDYEVASAWYQRAADQGFEPAMINLGQLYEQGLGVPKEPVTALNLYRRAAGFDEAGLAWVVTADVAGEIEDLRQEVAVNAEDAEAQQERILQLQSQISDLENQRRAMEQVLPSPVELRQIEESRNGFATPAPSASLEAERAALSQDRERALEAQAELERQLTDIEREREAIAAEAEALEIRRQETDLVDEAARNEIAALAADLEARRAAIDSRADTLAAREGELNRRELQLQQQERALEERAAEVAGQEEAIEARSGEISSLDQQIAELRDVFEAEQRRLQVMSEAQDVAISGPLITMIEPSVKGGAPTRGAPVVRTRAGVPERNIVGRVEAPAGLLGLVVNDRETTVDENLIFNLPVPLRDRGTVVDIVAIDKLGKRDELEFILQPDPDFESSVLDSSLPVIENSIEAPFLPPIDFGEFHALVIGNNDFAYLPRLDSAVKDARAVAELLETRYGFQVSLLENADRYSILSALNEMRIKLNDNDNLLIYYAGHGELDRTNQRGHWLPVDAEADNPANWISNVAITDILNTITAKRILVVSDSCYSGTLTRASLSNLEGGMTQEQRQAWIEAMASKRSRTAMTSGGLAPTLDGGGGEFSVFARAFMEALRENNGVLEGQALFREISARVTYEASRFQFEQVPQYAPIKYAGHEAGEFFFVPGA